MPEKLKPCPLCGETVEVIRRGNDLTKRGITVKCPKCRIQLTNAALRNGQEWLENITETAWNRRADPRIEKARKALMPLSEAFIEGSVAGAMVSEALAALEVDDA